MPVVQMPPHIQGRGAEVCCDGPRRPFAAETCGFDLDTEGLGFHGVPSLFARRFFPPAAAFGFCLFSGRDTFITPPGRKSNPMKSTRFSGKISSDPTKKSGRKTPLPYKAKTGIFSPAAPKNRRRAKKTGAAPHAPGGFAPCARPAAPRRRPADLAPCAPAPRRPPRRRATARPARPRPPQAPCARTGAAPFFAAPPPGRARLRSAGSRRRAPRPARPPKARRRPARAQKKARRPRRGPAAPAPRPVPQGGIKFPGAVSRGPRPPLA